jgi:hypothetical protein
MKAPSDRRITNRRRVPEDALVAGFDSMIDRVVALARIHAA